jgi:hypothetical protein
LRLVLGIADNLVSIKLAFLDHMVDQQNTARHKLTNALRSQFKNHRGFADLVAWRFLDLYGIPADEALALVKRGYYSPSAAMHDGVTRLRSVRPEYQRPYQTNGLFRG